VLGAIKSYLEGSLYPVVGIYPSRALVYDQARSVRETLQRMGLKEVEKDSFAGRLYINGEDKGGISIKIYTLTSEVKEIPREFQFPSSPSIVFTVPEYPYMFMTGMNKRDVASQVLEASMKYGFDEAMNALSVGRSKVRELLNYFSVFFNGYWFIDEFHLYSGIARGSMLTLLEMYEKFNRVIRGNKTVVFSSATPVPINVEKVIEAKASTGGSKIRGRTKVVFHLVDKDPQGNLVNYVQEEYSKGISQGHDNKGKVAAILDRVYYVAELCKNVSDAAVVWGLDKTFGHCRKVNKDLDKEGFIIGDQAISFGIDLDLGLGFIHAHDAETLIQRLGRFGRRGDAEVHVFLEANYDTVMELKALENKEITYDEFLKLIDRIYERRVDDKLDEIFFSRTRHDVLIRAFSLIYAISQGEQAHSVTREWYPQDVKGLSVRPSYDDYFYVFAYRPGGLKGKWCDGGSDNLLSEGNTKKEGSDDLFSLIRNFRYSEDGCFTDKTLKEAPGIIPRKPENVKCSFMQFKEFNERLAPRLVLKRQGYSILMGSMKEFSDSYVILLTEKCVNWKSFSEMAKLVSTYESAIPIYKDEDMNVVIGLAIFI